mmetsp:Transcript_16266/g.37459  ORF Transcript_16266/g.37459 Transcript_16266/m.37459 type:complete len:685 (-) Transcript_16266:158-2212(-)
MAAPSSTDLSGIRDFELVFLRHPTNSASHAHTGLTNTFGSSIAHTAFFTDINARTEDNIRSDQAALLRSIKDTVSRMMIANATETDTADHVNIQRFCREAAFRVQIGGPTGTGRSLNKNSLVDACRDALANGGSCVYIFMDIGHLHINPGEYVNFRNWNEQFLRIGTPFTTSATTSRPPLHPNNVMDEGEIRRIVDDQFTTRMARMRLDQPRRDLSLNSKSDAWRLMLHEKRITQGHSFFFTLKELPNNFDTRSFERKAETADADENKYHHPYFLDEIRTLVSDALKSGVRIRQQLLWTKHGHWLTLDDSPTNGTEPDFSMIQIDCDSSSVDSFVSTRESGVTTPSSKYDVSICFEQKKKFVETDLMEAIDYGQRLLRVQREREFALTALFHCQGDEKIIRWVRVEGGTKGAYTAKITRPFSLAPGGEGQSQFLTLLSMTSSEIGLVHPLVEPMNAGISCDVRSFAGRGATSKVYSAILGDREGALKILEPSFVHLVDHEVSTLAKLANLSGVPRAEKIAHNAIFLEDFLFPTDGCLRAFVEDLVSCLRGAHALGIVHRDVRPENVMKTAGGKVILNDWGCSAKEGKQVSFAGTFRYASEEVLTSVIQGTDRLPQPKDDLHSLVRTVIALNDVDVRKKLSDVADGNYHDAICFWEKWQQHNPFYAGTFFKAAETEDYETLKQLR